MNIIDILVNSNDTQNTIQNIMQEYIKNNITYNEYMQKISK